MIKRKRKELGLATLVLLGVGFALAAVLLTSFVLSLMISFTKNPTALTGAISLAALLLAGAISGFVTSRVNGEGGKLIAILSSVISAFVIIAIGLIAKGGAIGLSVPLNLLAFIAVSVISALLCKKRARKRRKKRF